MPTRCPVLVLLALLGLPACRQEAAPTSTPARPASRLTRSLEEPELRAEPVVLVRPGGGELPVPAAASAEPVAAVPAALPVEELAQAVPAVPLAPAAAEETQRRRGDGTPPRQEPGALNRVPLGTTHEGRLDGTRPRRRDHPELPDRDGRFKPTTREERALGTPEQRGQGRPQGRPQGRQGR